MLKDYFNNEIQNNKSKVKKIGEVFLFERLKDSIIGNDGLAYEYHGKRGMVSFNINKNQLKCEIADLLLIFIRGNQLRYTFLQNKYSRKRSDDNNIANMNSVQHYLLSERPHLISTPKGIPNNILQDAILPGVGSYGNFSYDSKTKKYDMVYFTAKTLKRKRKAVTKYSSKNNYTYFNSMTDSNWHCCINGSEECVHCSDLNEFEKKYNDMFIGTPVYLDSKEANNIVEIEYLFHVIHDCMKKNDNNTSTINKIEPIYLEIKEKYHFQDDDSFDPKFSVAIKIISDKNKH